MSTPSDPCGYLCTRCMQHCVGADILNHQCVPAQHLPAELTVDPAPQPVSVFEVIDYSNDEIYFSLGVFLTLEDAKYEINQDDPLEISNDKDLEDFVVYVIRERKIGMSGEGREVYRREWEQEYDEATDESKWVVKEVTQP